MENYFSYFPRRKGINETRLSACGFTRISAGAHYPPMGHPTRRAFTWDRGRAIAHWQLVAITEGEGEFESMATGHRIVSAGTWFILHPGRWHRYRPKLSKGWTEHWLELEGALPPVKETFFKIGEAPELISFFVRLHSLANSISSCHLLDSLAVHLFYSAQASSRQVEQPSSKNLVKSAQCIFLENLGEKLSVTEVAERLGVHPATLRRAFERCMGSSPKRYFDDLRLYRARDQISEGRLNLSAIAEDLGFDSPYHLSSRFKGRFGVSPRNWRNEIRNRLR